MSPKNLYFFFCRPLTSTVTTLAKVVASTVSDAVTCLLVQGKTCVGKHKGGGRKRGAGILAMHNSYRPPSFSRHRRQQVPSLKSSPMTDDAVASWHGFIMTLLLIMICQFSLAQPDCHFSLSPLELPAPLVGQGDYHFLNIFAVVIAIS